MPPIEIYETLQQSNATDAYLMNKDGAERLNRDDLDFFKKDDELSKKEGQSALNASVDGKGSPQKSLAIKGPPKIISEKLEL